MVLISVSLVLALILGYNLTKKYVDNEFSALKIDVLDKTLEPYNTFFQNKIPEISFYQGFLDSVSGGKYADSVIKVYPFVSRVLFYDAQISNHDLKDGLTIGNLAIGVKKIYQYGKNVNQAEKLMFSSEKPGSLSLSTGEEFNKIGLKLANFIEQVDTTKALNNEQIFKSFYSITNNRISYINIPRREDIKMYQDLMLKDVPISPFFEQDIFSFELDANQLKIENTQPALYQFVSVIPISFDPILERPNLITADIALPGPFSDYKIYFGSDREFLNKEVIRRFLPIALAVFGVYLVLALITFLIYRNLIINQKLFSLQYDFINNFTHEFKTPVSVIKIAGNNIRQSKELTDNERKRYGRILDEEADKLNDLMNKLLSFTQIENKTIKVNAKEINLEVFSLNIIDAFQLKYPEFDIKLHIKDLETYATDPVLLSSIYHNLIENAYKYAKEGNKNLKLDIYQDKKWIIFSFQDSGIGIEAKELENIFKKFYRIQSRYNQQGSIGLGLAFCKELVNFMNGSITVKSEPNKGSTFTVSLPNNN
jgi:two-component system phosphate regulon sensor histidine kinase PhoR